MPLFLSLASRHDIFAAYLAADMPLRLHALPMISALRRHAFVLIVSPLYTLTAVIIADYLLLLLVAGDAVARCPCGLMPELQR